MDVDVYAEVKNKNVIYVEQGRDLTGTATIKDPVTGLPYNLTGFTVVGQMKTVQGVLVGTLTCTVPHPLTGVIAFSLGHTATALLQSSTFLTIQHVWGIKMASADLSIILEVQGGVVVNPTVVTL